jgi:hypothetical protein
MRIERLSAGMLHIVHLGLTLSLPILLIFLFGCKKIEEEKAIYGPEVTGEAIDGALRKAIAGASLDNLAVGQFLDHSVVRRLENEDSTSTLGGTRVEVIDKVETDSTVKFTLKIFKSQRMAGGIFETKVTEENLAFNKSSLQNIGAMSLKSSRLSAAALSAEALAKPDRSQAGAQERKVARITYHNLSEFNEALPVPKTVREKPGCGGLSPCALQVRYIRFDMVQWYDDGGTTKVALDFGFSVQTPFLPFGEDFDQLSGLLILDCRSTYVPIENRTVYVRDCMTLEDFQK